MPEDPKQPIQTKVTGALPIYWMSDMALRIRAMSFLTTAYEGGPDYKNGYDMNGDPLLIEHEGESTVGVTLPGGSFTLQSSASGTNRETLRATRYLRRKRIAAYENNVKPIVDKYASYLTRTDPYRPDKAKEEAVRLNLDTHLDAMVVDGLKLTEAFIGLDAATMPKGDDGKPLTMTEMEARAIDPVNGGKPYIVTADPMCIVDYTESKETRRMTRIVIREVVAVKASLTEKETTTTYFTEWTDTEWKKYRKLEGDDITSELGGDAQVVLEAQGTHSFPRCPWVRFCPKKFPIKDIADGNRLLFNLQSLHNEELFQNTFTQKWATGLNTEAMQKLSTGTGTFLNSEDPDSKFGTFGAIPDQANSILEAINAVRDSIYLAASMDSVGEKNVAEAAEKKKRDLEALYTSLAGIVAEIERVENELHFLLGSADEFDMETRVQYPREFDVTTLSEALLNGKAANELAFMPASFKRAQALAVIQKIDAFGDHLQYREDVENAIDLTPTTVQSIVDLNREGLVTPEIVADLLGVPEKMRAEFIKAVEGHKEKEAAGGGFGDMTDQGDMEDVVAGQDGGEEPGAGNPGGKNPFGSGGSESET